MRGVSGNRYSYRDRVFTGETYLQTEPPIEPSSLTRWRKRLGEAGIEELLAETIEAARRAGVIKASSVKRVTVDTTVMVRREVAYVIVSPAHKACDETGCSVSRSLPVHASHQLSHRQFGIRSAQHCNRFALANCSKTRPRAGCIPGWNGCYD